MATGGTLQLSGVISGTGFGLTKIGGGTLDLATPSANTYDGTTSVLGGILSVADDASLGGGSVQLADATTLTITGDTDIDNSITLGGANVLIFVSSGHSAIISGIILELSGVNGLTKIGTGTLRLSASNSYTGQSFVNAGTLSLSGGFAIDDGSAVIVADGATLRLLSGETIGSLSGAGIIDLSTFTLTTGGDDSSTTFSGTIGGLGGLSKAGTGVLTLSGANTFEGNTVVNAGMLRVENAQALGAPGDTNGGFTNVQDGASLVLDVPNLTLDEFIYLSGQGAGGLPTLWNEADGITLNGEISLYFATVSNFVPLGTADGTTMTIAGVISEATSGMVPIFSSGATGRVILAGDNTYTGSFIASSGFVRATNSNAFGDSVTALDGYVSDGATLEFAGDIFTPANKALFLDDDGVAGSAKLVNVSGNNVFGERDQSAARSDDRRDGWLAERPGCDRRLGL